MSAQINVAVELRDELAVALHEALGIPFDEATKYTTPIVSYLQQQYGKERIYIPQPYLTRDANQIRAARAAGEAIADICRKNNISRRTFYRLLSEG